jgi:hypothetical protein
MNWVSGSLIIRDWATASSESGWRRHAFSLRAPLENAFAATFASVASEIPCSSL